MRNENGDRVDQNRDILAEIAAKTKARVANLDAAAIEAAARALPKDDFAFERALAASEMAYICEVKKSSPSKGLIAKEFDYLRIAKDYEQEGATAISCLTEPFYFQGKNEYLKEITDVVSIPVLRKDFFVAPVMIYEAKCLGAAAVLLICAILTDAELAEYFAIANELGLSAIFEAHDAGEVARAARCGARIIGVNNRNLKTFALDLNNSIQLRGLVSKDILFISESGIKTNDDIKRLQQHEIRAVLVGETLMKAADKKQMLDALKGVK